MGTALERLSFDDAQILGLESSAIKGHTCKVAIAEARPGGSGVEIEELRRRIAAGLDRAPRCRQRLEFTPLRLAGPAWVDDPEFDVDWHVRRADQGGPVPLERFREIAAGLMAERLDHRRPLWRVDLIELEAGRTGIVTRIHHCMADGISALRIGESLLWDSKPQSSAADPPPWDPAPPPTKGRLIRSALGHHIAGARGAAGRALRVLVSPRRWQSALRSLYRLPGTLRRELGHRASGSPFDRRLGEGRELAFAACDLDDLKRIEKAFGDRITVNDVVLAAVGGGLRRWLESRGGGGIPGIRVQVPVSMHHRDESAAEIGNRDSFLYVDLPLDEEDPIERLLAINAETVDRKERHDADELYAFFHAISHLRPAHREAIRLASTPSEFSLSVSNVPGPRQPVYVAGAPVSELYSFAEPADRHVLRVSAVSLAGRLSFGICTDPAALEDVGAIADGIEASVAEMLERARR